MIKNILKIFNILLLGAVGGLLFQIFVLPYLFTNPYFERFQFIKTLKEREIVVNPKEEIIIQENIALETAIEKVEKSVVGISAKKPTGEIVKGSGFIISSDGLMVTLSSLIPQGSIINFFIEEEGIQYKILKRDASQDLALVKLEKNNLTTRGFANSENNKLGERVFLMGIVFYGKGDFQKIVNEGIIQSFNEDYIKTNIFERDTIEGSPLFDIEGNLLGINTINSEGKIIAIPVDKIKSFTGF